MYHHAYRLRHDLELNDLETFITRRSVIDHGAMMAFGLLSSLLAVAMPLRMAGLSGMVYWLVPVYFTVTGMTLGRQQRRLAEGSGLPTPAKKHAKA